MVRNLSAMTLALLLAACSSGDGVDTRPVQGDVGGTLAETVNGTPVPQALLDAVARAHKLDLTRPEQRSQALNLLTDFVLLAQAAKQENLFGDAAFRAEVEAARLQALGNATLDRLQQQAPITDAVVRAEYDAQVARAGKYEYDFTQLLFDNEEDALKAESELVAGKAFSSVYDAWRGKCKQAKVFTRVRKDQIPTELFDALTALHNGEATKAPVKTGFGWHVVHLDIVNPFSPPPFEQLRDAIRQGMLRKVGQERMRQLKEQAKIEYPPGVAPPMAKPESEKPGVDEHADKGGTGGRGKD